MKKSHVVILSIVLAVLVGFASSVLTLIGAGFYAYENGSFVQMPMAPAEVNSGYDYHMLDEVAGSIESIALRPVDEEKKRNMLVQAAKGMVFGTGDLYAAYYTPEEFIELMEDSEGVFVGIGVLVQLNQNKNLVEVIRVYDNTPAQEMGIQMGDCFCEIDGEDVTGFDINQVKAKVVGKEGTTVRIKFLRENQYVDLEVMRRKVLVNRVLYKMVEDDIAYISIDSFEGDAAELFREAVQKLVMEQKAEGMILDLRSNPGGDKNIVLDIADVLLPPGPAFITEDKDGNTETDYTTSEALGIPLVVLVNDTSASASELLSGNIKDYGMGKLVGVNTYGKGTVQTFTRLSDGSVLKLTTYTYKTGKGTPVQDVGVAPDYVVEPTEALEKEYSARLTDQDNQYQKAVEVLRGLIADASK